MVIFYSIKTFRSALCSLCSKPKEGYSSVIKDICKEFKEKPIEEIRINRDMIISEDKFTIIKLRLPNSGQNLSKKNGFRLIYLVHKQNDEVTFLYIYPKRGPKGLITIKDNEILSLLDEFAEENKGSLLVSHDIENELEEIKINQPNVVIMDITSVIK
ncbi:hypothetical protein [uncultured Bacteroides sp.]|uniref:hypothetical protein n=1 Tax=uncultured Bacteroides sp. TaxID=162156 RepID=UPI002AAA7F65|nr:hypothetical protein [uncultured Bacteroides sp.]